MTITIQDVIAHNGPRVPSFENSPKALNTAIVAVTLHGRQPSRAMLTQLEGIARGVDRLLVQGHRRRVHDVHEHGPDALKRRACNRYARIRVF